MNEEKVVHVKVCIAKVNITWNVSTRYGVER